MKCNRNRGGGCMNEGGGSNNRGQRNIRGCRRGFFFCAGPFFRSFLPSISFESHLHSHSYISFDSRCVCASPLFCGYSKRTFLQPPFACTTSTEQPTQASIEKDSERDWVWRGRDWRRRRRKNDRRDGGGRRSGTTTSAAATPTSTTAAAAACTSTAWFAIGTCSTRAGALVAALGWNL